MCAGKKKCNRCKLAGLNTRKMARKKKIIGGVNIEKVAFIAGGAIAGKAVNKLANKVIDKQTSEKTKDILRKAIPAGKVVIGAVAMAHKKTSTMVKDMALGFVATGALELIEQLAPQVTPALSGMDYETGYMHGIPVSTSAVAMMYDEDDVYDEELESSVGYVEEEYDEELESSVGAVYQDEILI